MRTKTKQRKGRSSRRRARPIHKPRGVLQPRVQRVGPEHFGIVSIDCAKARSKWMLTDFYGTILVPPTELPHSRGHFSIAVALLREAIAQHGLKDLVVAIEQTGTYHQPVKRALSIAGFECRTVHPLARKSFRQAAHPGIKTDDTDLIGIFCAAANGFGLREPSLDPRAAQLRLWVRHRRDLVQKRSAVCCQLQEHWQASLPGFAAPFDDLWTTPAAVAIACHFASPEAIHQAGLNGFRKVLHALGQRAQTGTLQRVLAWACTAPPGDPESALHRQLAQVLDEDRRLRAALLGIAANLLKCNHYFQGLAGRWKAEGKDPRDAHVKVASRFSRLMYLIVAGKQIVPHPCLQPRGYILDKLIAFHQKHQTSPEQMLVNLHQAAAQLPADDYLLEAVPLVQRLRKTIATRRRGPQSIGNILPLLLAKLGVGQVESTPHVPE